MLDLASFQIQNPWRVGQYKAEGTLQRQLLGEVLQWLNVPDILVIVGSRQVGKTTLLFQIINHLLSKSYSPADIFYFNLDDLNLLEFFDSPTELIKFVELHKKDRAYVFIDEIQRLENPGLFLKYIYDLKKKIKLIVTGSSSLEIQAKISESLTGRKQLFHLYSFSFREFISSKWPEFSTVEKKLEIHHRNSFFESVNKVQNLYESTFDKALSEYLAYGGYPRVVLEEDPQRKIWYLKEIFTSYLQKDVKDFFRIENVSGYNNLLKILASQIGNLVNISELANTLGLHKATIEKYLYLLEGTFVFKRLSPFYRNVRREISKMPKIYALDLGIRNFAIGSFGDILVRADRGEMAENFVFTELQQQIEQPNELHFWRTQTKAEVDLIIEFPDNVIPVEVKFRPMNSPQMSRSLRSFLDSYNPPLGLVFTKNYSNKITVDKTKVMFLPLWALLFLKLEYLQCA